MFKVNKNVTHNGTYYAAGSEIKESAEGFKELLKCGHVNKDDGSAIPVEEIVIAAPTSAEPETVKVEAPVHHKLKKKKE